MTRKWKSRTLFAAEEHLSNTPIQILLHRALGNRTPEWAHVPYVASPGSKEKMSKRKIDKYRTSPQFQKLFELADQVLSRIGIDSKPNALSPVMVAYYRQVGFLPAGVLNALVRWVGRSTIKQNFVTDGDETEIHTGSRH